MAKATLKENDVSLINNFVEQIGCLRLQNNYAEADKIRRKLNSVGISVSYLKTGGLEWSGHIKVMLANGVESPNFFIGRLNVDDDCWDIYGGG